MFRPKYWGRVLAVGLSAALVSVSAARADDLSDAAKARAMELRRQRAMHQPAIGTRFDSRQGEFASRLNWSWYGPDQFGYAPFRQDARRAELRREPMSRTLPRSDFANDIELRSGKLLDSRDQALLREDRAEFDAQAGRPWSSAYGTYEDLDTQRTGPAHRGTTAFDSRFGWDRYSPGRGEGEWEGYATLPREGLESANRALWGHISMLEREIEQLRSHVAAIENGRFHAGAYGPERTDHRPYGVSPHDMW